jgi:quinol monooxygenase YgiN
MNATSFPVGSANHDQQISMLVTFRVKSEMQDNFKQALLNDLIHAREESGCISMDLFADKADSNTLFFFERWQDQTALDNHFSQPYTQEVLVLAETALVSPMQILYLTDLAPLPLEDIKRSIGNEGVDLIVIFEVKDGMQERFQAQFLNSVHYSRPEPGCIAFHIHAVKGSSNTFVLYERWENQAAFDFHLAQPYTQELFESFKDTLAKPVEECLIYISDLVPA